MRILRPLLLVGASRETPVRAVLLTPFAGATDLRFWVLPDLGFGGMGKIEDGRRLRCFFSVLTQWY